MRWANNLAVSKFVYERLLVKNIFCLVIQRTAVILIVKLNKMYAKEILPWDSRIYLSGGTVAQFHCYPWPCCCSRQMLSVLSMDVPLPYLCAFLSKRCWADQFVMHLSSTYSLFSIVLGSVEIKKSNPGETGKYIILI